jgi:hypothetical protein
VARLIIGSPHVFERALERCRLKPDEAKAALVEVKQVVTEQAPLDWRFTTSPAAKFILCYEPERVNCRLVGRTYRDRQGKGQELIKRLAEPRITPEDLSALAAEYRNLLFDPGCDIFHELKTTYGENQELSEEKAVFSAARSVLDHVIPIDERRVADRPNALIVGAELWVRQGEFLDLAGNRKGDYQDSLLFERLTLSGVDKSVGRIYRINRQAQIEFGAEHRREWHPVGPVPRPEGQRSQSYWVLPTYLDMVHMDLEYARTHWRGDGEYSLDAGRMLLWQRIETLVNLAWPNRTRYVVGKR